MEDLGPDEERIQTLAGFRSLLRKFLQFSEAAATQVGLTPQQHQLLLQIAGATPGTVTSVSYLAERLALRHHSVVELSKRGEEAGLVVRAHDPENRRHVVLELTPEGHRMLKQLSAAHARELDELGPQLIGLLSRLTDSHQTHAVPSGTRPDRERSGKAAK